MELLISGFGIFTSFILFYYMRDLNKSNRLLAAFFFITNFNVLYFYVMVFSNNPFWEAIFFSHFLPLTFLVSPLLFFYIKFSFRPARFKWSDLWHYSPAIIILLFSIPYTTLSFDEKYKLAHNLINESSIYSPETVAFAFYFRAIYRFGYTIFTFFYFRWLLKKTKTEWEGERRTNPSFRTWIYYLIGIQLLNSILPFAYISTIPGFSFSSINQYLLGQKDILFRITGVLIFSQNFVLFLYPKILFGNLTIIENNPEETFVDQLKASINKKTNDPAVDQQISDLLEAYLPQKTYLEKRFSIAKLSYDLNISERVLSNYFNAYLDTSFSTWKNKLRIQQAVKLIDQSQLKYVTIEGIGEMVGFQSRTNFIEVFKEQVGKTPSEYLKG
jgi:AraC-like DNA-binding protein